MPRITDELERKNAFSSRLTHKRKFVEKPEPTGMTEPQMRVCELHLTNAKRYVANLHVMILDPSPEQAEQLQAQIADLGAEIQALGAKIG